MDDPWVAAWAAAARKRRADAPRRAAIRAGFEAARKFQGHPPGEVRDVLQAGMAARGITDLTSAQLELLTDAVVTSPRRAALTAAWTNSPSKAQRLEWRGDQDVVRAVVELDPDADTIVARLFDEVPEMWGESEHSEESVPRFFPCWVDVGPADKEAGTVTVHVGKHVIGRLRAADAGCCPSNPRHRRVRGSGTRRRGGRR